MALIDENDLLGAILEKEYGQSQSQDTHIDYFYLVLRGELIEKRDRIKILDQLKKIGEWTYDETDWPEFMVGKFPYMYITCYCIGKFPKVAPSETERHREERVNVTIRQQLLLTLYHASNKTLETSPPTHLPNPPESPHLIIGRVCKYNREVDSDSTTTESQQEKSLDINPQNVHLEFFYLVINWEKCSGEIEKEIQSALSTLPEEWKAIMSVPELEKKHWRHLLVGYFPKRVSETEREREWRLNEEFRDPLRDQLKTIMANQLDLDSTLKVTVLLMRACK